MIWGGYTCQNLVQIIMECETVHAKKKEKRIIWKFEQNTIGKLLGEIQKMGYNGVFTLC